MAPLSPKAQALIKSGREGLRPTEKERQRVEAVLDASAGAPIKAPPLRANQRRLVAPLAVGAVLVGGVLFFLTPSRAPLPTPQVRAPSVSSAPSSAASGDGFQPSIAPQVASSTVPQPVDSSSPALLARPPSVSIEDGLTREVALMSRAASALRAGRASEALRVINEHERKFPNGVLSLERRAVKAQALCSAKRVAEGQAELRHLALNSPASARAKQVCDAAAGPATD